MDGMALDDGAAAEAAGPDDDGEAIPAEQQFDEATVRALLQGAFEREGTQIDGVAASLTGEVLRMFVLGARLARTSPSPLPLPSPLRGRPPRPTHPTPLLLCAKLFARGAEWTHRAAASAIREAEERDGGGGGGGGGGGAAASQRPAVEITADHFTRNLPQVRCLGKMNEGRRISDAVLVLASQMLLDFS